MPPINIYKCSQCQKVLHTGWGGYQYAENKQGERVCCPHPVEDNTICKVLGIAREELYSVRPPYPAYKVSTPAWWWSRKRKEAFQNKMAFLTQLVEAQAGFNSYCICKDCLQMCELDLGDAEASDKSWRRHYAATLRKDERKCPHCGSYEIATIMELVETTCPFCKTGRIIEIETGAIA